ncbi:hypothetical protein FB45DRAFT_873516 [Roridomyces roridus]|uniref:Uncharacterized protein n=1 Tax=Roridomyces roridus TaxID=1738132 RepID=A0AAD7BB17_9AGAR|nr:hypothetical protein FB45DRAFT_873516 [Roridomyces roridus]
MILTARRVKIWVGPILYRILALAWERGIKYPLRHNPASSCLPSTPIIMMRDCVRHLYLEHVPIAWARFLLSNCDNVEDVCLFDGDYTSLLDRLGARRTLRRLHCSLQDLFGPREPDFNHPIFSRLTHLTLFPGVIPTEWTGLASLLHLTHLSVSDYGFLTLISEALKACPSLRVAICLVPDESVVSDLEISGLDAMKSDPRFVCMLCITHYTTEWFAGTTGGLDRWNRAEEFISRRDAGEIERTQFIVPADDSSSLEMPVEFRERVTVATRPTWTQRCLAAVWPQS